MNGYKLTRIWVVNNKMVVAYTIEEAIELYRKYVNTEVEVEVETVELLRRNVTNYMAIISDK